MAYTTYTYKQIKRDSITKTQRALGRKGLILTSLTSNKTLKQAIPPFSIISSDLYYDFIQYINQHKDTAIEGILKNFNLKQRLADYLPKLLKDLITNGKYRLAIRPSIGCSKVQDLRFSGLLPTYLNITNIDELVNSIENILISTTKETFLLYLKSNNLSYNDISVSIIIQKLIIPESAGIAYPYNPVTQNTNEITIEAVYGLGDVITKGEIIPDIYIVTQKNFEIKEKKLAPQSWMRMPNYNKAHNVEHTEKIELSQLMQHTQKLEDNEIISIAKLVQTLNTDPKNIWLLEWGLSGSKIYIYQVKHLGTKPHTQEIKQLQPKKLAEYTPPLLQGLPLSNGIGVGKIHKWLDLKSDQKFPDQDFILVAKTIQSDQIAAIRKSKCKGIILDTVVPNNEISLLLQDLHIPAIGGTYYATTILKQGTVIKLDANTGSVYKVSIATTNKRKAKTPSKKSNTSKTKSKAKATNSPKRKQTKNSALNILQITNNTYYTNQNKTWFVYDTTTKTKDVEHNIKNNPHARHLVIRPLLPNSKNQLNKLLKDLNKINTGTIIPTFIITSFQDLIHATKQSNKQLALLIDISALYTIYNGKQNTWKHDAAYIAFLEQMLLRYREDSNILLGALIKNKTYNTLSLKDLQILQTLGFVFLVTSDTL